MMNLNPFKTTGIYHTTYIKKDGKYISLEDEAKDFCLNWIKPVHPENWDWTKRDFDKPENKPTKAEASIIAKLIYDDLSDKKTQIDLSNLLNKDAVKAFFDPASELYDFNMEEFAYALDVELEHGKIRDANVTGNHPFLTAMVVLAHMTESLTYYKRLKVMETEAEIFEIERKIADKTFFKKDLENKLTEKQIELEKAKTELQYRLDHMNKFPVMKELE